MPDWRALTAERLAGLRLPEARRQEVVQELSEHMEDEFSVLREQVSEEEAQRRALELLAERDILIREIRKAEKEDPMTQTARLVLCGVVAGAVAYLLAITAFAFVGEEFIATVRAARSAAAVPAGPVSGLLHLAAGVWVMWLYTSLRPRHGAGSRTAALAGFALWLVGAFAAAMWTTLGFIPPAVLFAAAAVGLPAWILGALAGAYPMELSERKPAQPLKAS